MINVRTLAYHILLHLGQQRASHPERLIRTTLQRHSRLEDRDRALLKELVYGVVRWQGRLDWHIDQLSRIKPAKIDPVIRILLRLGLYQILFLDRVPAHAAVNETVSQAKAAHPAHLAGFVNAVLREAIRRGDKWQWPLPEKKPAEYLAAVTSHPLWFVTKCLKELGFEETQRLCEANNMIAPMTLRVNPLKASSEQVLAWLTEQEVAAEPSAYLSHAVRLSGLRQDIVQTPLHTMGWVQVQDEASQLVAHLVAPQPGERVLDLCSGFGGKATHLGILMQNKGEILAVDQAAWKLEELQANAQRQGIGIIRTQAEDILELQPGRIGLFDRVLLDAPCSGFGTLRRKPDIKWRRHLKDPYRFSQIQKALLQHAAQFVRAGGVLVYATCTHLFEEDEAVAEHFGETHAGWVVEPAVDLLPPGCRSMVEGKYFKSWPHRHGVDGFFGARWRRKA